MSKPSPTTYPPYFQKYIDQVEDEDLLTGFALQSSQIKNLLGSITEEKSTYAYAPGKWTIKDLLQHVIDTERKEQIMFYHSQNKLDFEYLDAGSILQSSKSYNSKIHPD